jgi:hypothetical protein
MRRLSLVRTSHSCRRGKTFRKRDPGGDLTSQAMTGALSHSSAPPVAKHPRGRPGPSVSGTSDPSWLHDPSGPIPRRDASPSTSVRLLYGCWQKFGKRCVPLNMRRESLTELISVNAVWCQSGAKISPPRATSFECQSANGEAPLYSCIRIHTACSAWKPPVRLPSGEKRARSSEHAKLSMQTTACQKQVNPVTLRLCPVYGR